MLTNIFGMHLGCKIKVGRATEELIGVRKEYAITRNGKGIVTRRPLEDCKIILKPLSAITEEHKEAYFKEFPMPEQMLAVIEKVVGFNERGLEVITKDSPYSCESRYTHIQAVWLASKGYDVGIIPDEYKEVEE